MATEKDKLKRELMLKEERLLENATRTDTLKLDEILGPGCIAQLEDGRRVDYAPGSLFDVVEGALYIESDAIDLVDLAEDCKLLVYVAAKVNKNKRSKYRCGSVWKKADGTWKIAFHQRTPMPDKAPGA